MKLGKKLMMVALFGMAVSAFAAPTDISIGNTACEDSRSGYKVEFLEYSNVGVSHNGTYLDYLKVAVSIDGNYKGMFVVTGITSRRGNIYLSMLETAMLANKRVDLCIDGNSKDLIRSVRIHK